MGYFRGAGPHQVLDECRIRLFNCLLLLLLALLTQRRNEIGDGVGLLGTAEGMVAGDGTHQGEQGLLPFPVLPLASAQQAILAR